MKSEMLQTLMSSFYAVRQGRVPGIYTEWEEAACQVNGFPGAIYKKYKSLEQATQFVDSGIDVGSWKDLLHSGSNMRKRSVFRCLKMEDVPNTKDPMRHTSAASHTSEYVPHPVSIPARAPTPEIVPRIDDTPQDALHSLMCKYYKLYDDSGNLYVYTDGSTYNNGSKKATGGYGVFFSHCAMPYISERMSKGKITSGAAEVLAITHALQYITQNLELISTLTNNNIIIWYDAEYAAGVIQGTLQAHTNLEIVQEARDLLKRCRSLVTFKHVYSHTEKKDLHSIGNEIADKLAKKKHTTSTT